jgi:hypothetical protein
MADARQQRLRTLLGVHGPDLSRLAARCAYELPDIAGVSIVVVGAAKVQGLVSAAGQLSRQLEELQLTLGEGPSVDAYASGTPVLVADMSSQDSRGRWPGFSEAMANEGVRAMYAFPLQLGAIRVGTLALHRMPPGPLADGELTVALTCAEAATLLLLGASGMDTGEGDSRFDHSAVVHQATGMVMVQLGVTVEEAFVRLRAHAFSAGGTLDSVAREIVGRQFRFSRPQDSQ